MFEKERGGGPFRRLLEAEVEERLLRFGTDGRAGLHADVRCAARGRALGSAERQKRKNERHIVGVTREGKSMLSDGRHVWCVASGFGNENLMRRKGN